MNERGLLKLSDKAKYLLFTVFLCFCIVIVGITGYLNWRAMNDSRLILEKSVKSQLLSIAAAAREIVDVYAFDRYNELGDIDSDYQDQLAKLRSLVDHSDAKYIYALRRIDDASYFVFDTDADGEPFTEYETTPLFDEAFAGKDVAGISNLVDEFGSFSTAAVPLRMDGKVIGIMCVDIEDILLRQNQEAGLKNFLLLVSLLGGILAAMSALVYLLLGRIKQMQDRLKRMANFDKLTNLPNRQYLMDYLAEVTAKGRKTPFAMLFIDLDNFKQVNDNAGHDAGDSLLQHIGSYLDQAQQNSQVFRPGPGMLNIAARIGGDEFILIAPNIGTAEDASAFAQELLAGFRHNHIDRYIAKYQVGLSIGISLYPFHSDNYNVLIKYADIAMYHAKFGGKNCYKVYTDEMKSKEEK